MKKKTITIIASILLMLFALSSISNAATITGYTVYDPYAWWRAYLNYINYTEPDFRVRSITACRIPMSNGKTNIEVSAYVENIGGNKGLGLPGNMTNAVSFCGGPNCLYELTHKFSSVQAPLRGGYSLIKSTREYESYEWVADNIIGIQLNTHYWDPNKGITSEKNRSNNYSLLRITSDNTCWSCSGSSCR